MALKSSDDVLEGPTTRATVLTLQDDCSLLANVMIMSQPRSPFIKRWMLNYKYYDDDFWDWSSVRIPFQMYAQGGPDVTALSKESWLYPLFTHQEGEYNLMTMWLGKSWHDIGNNYGVHFWKFELNRKFRNHLNPETVRLIDTPLFCKVRKLFDNIDADGYYSIPLEQDPICSFTWTSDLRVGDRRQFSDYRMNVDKKDMKWIDSSSQNLHGWAPRGSRLIQNTTDGTTARLFTPGSHSILPVPADWDARVCSFRMMVQFQRDSWPFDGDMGLFKIRIETGGGRYCLA